MGNARDPKAFQFPGHQGLLKNGTNSGGVVVNRWYDVVVFQCVFKTVSFCLVLYSIGKFINAASIPTKRYPFVPHPNLLPEGEGTGVERPSKTRIVGFSGRALVLAGWKGSRRKIRPL